MFLFCDLHRRNNSQPLAVSSILCPGFENRCPRILHFRLPVTCLTWSVPGQRRAHVMMHRQLRTSSRAHCNAPPRNRRTAIVSVQASSSGSRSAASAPGRSSDFAANLVSQVVSLALRARLKRCGSIDLHVDTDGFALLAGQVRGATMHGRDWESPERLTARLLQFTMGMVSIDYSALITQRNIVLRNVPRGDARILFSASDFGHFLVHPLMRAAAAKSVDGMPFAFDREGVLLQLVPEPTALFTGVAASDGNRYSIRMVPNARPPGQGVSGRGSPLGVTITARSMPASESVGSSFSADASDDGSAGNAERDVQVSKQLTSLFNELLIDLQGVELRFRSLAIDQDTSAPAVLDLRLSVRMASFPPLNMAF